MTNGLYKENRTNGRETVWRDIIEEKISKVNEDFNLKTERIYHNLSKFPVNSKAYPMNFLNFKNKEERRV